MLPLTLKGYMINKFLHTATLPSGFQTWKPQNFFRHNLHSFERYLLWQASCSEVQRVWSSKTAAVITVTYNIHGATSRGYGG